MVIGMPGRPCLDKRSRTRGLSLTVHRFVGSAESIHLEPVVDRVAKVVGSEHSGIGTDWDLQGVDQLPAHQVESVRHTLAERHAFRERIDNDGFDHSRKFHEPTEALARRGCSDAPVKTVLGSNFRRLLGNCVQLSANHQQPRGRTP